MKETAFEVLHATEAHVESMNALSMAKRQAYALHQPVFWKHKGPAGEAAQRAWFHQLLQRPDWLLWVAQGSDGSLLGFVIGRLVEAPEVYNPGGLTLMIDDFCVQHERDWEQVGGALLKNLSEEARQQGACQKVVVSGAHDHVKAHFLKQEGLSVASHWWVGAL